MVLITPINKRYLSLSAPSLHIYKPNSHRRWDQYFHRSLILTKQSDLIWRKPHLAWWRQFMGPGMGEESVLNWKSENGQIESKQQGKEFIRKRHERDCTNFPEAKKKRVSFAADLERMKVFDKRMKLTITPSTASPGRSIIMKKKDGPKTSSSLFATLKSKDKSSGKKNMFSHLGAEQSHNEVIRTEEIEQENSTMKLAVTNSKEKETIKLGESKVQKIGCGKI
ncbi:unnamed protein product, partial [Onchocerca flexuosa]|uniref:TPX2 domain-containing protein n=1 Tax=Onchocerca flexuosa TaxID=387005 RepID=A0A183H4G0_9BILA